jgi:hypothetical protein
MHFLFFGGGEFKNNEYLIRHKLKDINTVGNNIMKLVNLGLPLPTYPHSPNRAISGVDMMLGEVGLHSYWLKLSFLFVYSYVHTLFGPFLLPTPPPPSTPPPLPLTSRQNLFSYL